MNQLVARLAAIQRSAESHYADPNDVPLATVNSQYADTRFVRPRRQRAHSQYATHGKPRWSSFVVMLGIIERIQIYNNNFTKTPNRVHLIRTSTMFATFICYRFGLTLAFA